MPRPAYRGGEGVGPISAKPVRPLVAERVGGTFRIGAYRAHRFGDVRSRDWVAYEAIDALTGLTNQGRISTSP